jgi:tRNA pseudouridine38-40 synthase
VKYVILISYDGLNYNGWQMQKRDTTISSVLHDSYKNIFHTDLRLVGASRTDSGVHALGQVALVDIPLKIDKNVLLSSWNKRLPKDIYIRAIQNAPEDFHPLKNVERKIYYYHFFIQKPLPFISRYGILCKHPIDLEKLNKALNVFVGTHDFRSFCTGYEQENTVRTVELIKVVYLKKFKTYRIIISGKGFLRHMIRRIVGAAFDIAMRDDKTIDDIVWALQQKNPHQQLPNAKPHGLLLRRIFYSNLKW